MVTLAIVAIMAGIGLPSMTEILKKNQMSNHANAMHNSIRVARSEAIKRAVAVKICTSNAAQTDCATDTNWEDGWIVREVVRVTGQDPIISVQPPLASHFTFRSSTSASASAITFNPSGTTADNGTLVLCNQETVDDSTKSVVISQFGQVSVRGTDRLLPTHCTYTQSS